MGQEQLLSGGISSDSGNNHGTGYAVLVRHCARMQDASFDLNEWARCNQTNEAGVQELDTMGWRLGFSRRTQRVTIVIVCMCVCNRRCR